MMVARFKHHKNEGYLDTSSDDIWQFVLDNNKNWRTDESIVPLYLSKRLVPGETSLIVFCKDPNRFLEFLWENIFPLNSVSGVHIFNLMNSRFHPIPSGTCSDLKRFTVTISAKPKDFKAIYDAISRIKPTKYFVVGYVAYTFMTYGNDIVASILAKSMADAKSGIKEHIESAFEVLNTEIVRVAITKRLYSHSQEKFLKNEMDFCHQTPGLDSF